jgi:hypothetical protein
MSTKLSPNYGARSHKSSSGNGLSVLATLIAPLISVLLTHYFNNLNTQEKREQLKQQTTFKLPIQGTDVGRQDGQRPELCPESSMAKDLPKDHARFGQEFPPQSKEQSPAKKLIGVVNATQNNPADQFVLLLSIKDTATQAGDGQTAFQAIDTLAEKYKADAIIMKMTALAKFASAAQKPEQHRSIAEQALKLADQAISQNHFMTANQLDRLAIAEAKGAADRELLAHAQGHLANVAELVEARERRLK